MSTRFAGPAVLVRDLAASRRFYEEILEQTVLADHGPHVAYAGGFSLWLADHASALLAGPEGGAPVSPDGHGFELYFEDEALDAAWARAEAAGARVLHPIVVQPWLQRCFRLLDPDGHVVEVGEPLPGLIRRLAAEGLDAAEISRRTSIPADQVAAALHPSDAKAAPGA
ncbi:MAG: VOC family protein [Desulfovibrionaceae bacterium]